MSHTAHKTSLGRIAQIFKADIMCQQRQMLSIVGFVFILHYATKYLWLLLEGNYWEWSRAQTFDAPSVVFSGVTIAILMGYWYINKRFHALEPMPFSLVPARLREKCISLFLVMLSYIAVGLLSSWALFLVMWLQFPNVHLSDFWFEDVAEFVTFVWDWEFSSWTFIIGCLMSILLHLTTLWSVIRIRSYFLGLIASGIIMFGSQYLMVAVLWNMDITSGVTNDTEILMLIALYEAVCCALVARQTYRLISTTPC